MVKMTETPSCTSPKPQGVEGEAEGGHRYRRTDRRNRQPRCANVSSLRHSCNATNIHICKHKYLQSVLISRRNPRISSPRRYFRWRRERKERRGGGGVGILLYGKTCARKYCDTYALRMRNGVCQARALL